jgi:DNA-binding NarL/FixJ family response regulator
MAIRGESMNYANNCIRIVLIHPNQLFRECLSYCLAQAGSITVVHNGSALEQAGEQLTLYRPDILLVGFDLVHGHEMANFGRRWALKSEIKTLVIDVPESEKDIIYCIEKVGAHAYLKRDASINDLLNHTRAIMRGETFCSPRIASLVFCRVSDLAQRVNGLEINRGYLTKRETEIAILIEDGLSNKEIAVRLGIEVSTVKNHVHSLLDKLQLHDRRSAAREMRVRGLISAPPKANSSQSGSRSSQST